MTNEIIHEQLWNESQSWLYERITADVIGRKIRVYIRRNAYDDQCIVKAEFWNGTGWAYVLTTPISQLTCARVSYVQKAVDIKLFQFDADGLDKTARKVIQ